MVDYEYDNEKKTCFQHIWIACSRFYTYKELRSSKILWINQISSFFMILPYLIVWGFGESDGFEISVSGSFFSVHAPSGEKQQKIDAYTFFGVNYVYRYRSFRRQGMTGKFYRFSCNMFTPRVVSLLMT
ncbi:hypothetical protein ISN45_Aa08g024510 [Arabidopsis thaliana x Arabidopsis arenosa]|uniref:Transmembrane protein n=1 Tax=Arabidopsis thaliana x Arabidopsis arenosa TaxID=1240361 RepID=A0A8T1XKB7_9BRAS|nr:hypothetical protein ISN45_Aa08g024510 [Arabidopsis thaliana x Arabidopsis arenosa]